MRQVTKACIREHQRPPPVPLALRLFENKTMIGATQAVDPTKELELRQLKVLDGIAKLEQQLASLPGAAPVVSRRWLALAHRVHRRARLPQVAVATARRCGRRRPCKR